MILVITAIILLLVMTAITLPLALSVITLPLAMTAITLLLVMTNFSLLLDNIGEENTFQTYFTFKTMHRCQSHKINLSFIIWLWN